MWWAPLETNKKAKVRPRVTFKNSHAQNTSYVVANMGRCFLPKRQEIWRNWIFAQKLCNSVRIEDKTQPKSSVALENISMTSSKSKWETTGPCLNIETPFKLGRCTTSWIKAVSPSVANKNQWGDIGSPWHSLRWPERVRRCAIDQESR